MKSIILFPLFLETNDIYTLLPLAEFLFEEPSLCIYFPELNSLIL